MKLTERELAIARDWCVECWPDQEDEIRATSDAQIERVIEREWDGGIADFIRTNQEIAA